ncbi:MAG: hypothetical protein ACLPV2_09820 [Steroidobacteraceae bacterium]
MYDGTLCTAGPWQALVTFQQFIVLARSDGVVDMTPSAISARTTIPLAIIEAGIEALERPDPESRSLDHEGRRIVRLSEHRTWGWRIVNHAKYRAIRDEEGRRDYQREWDRTHRPKRDRGRKPDSNPTNPTATRHARQNPTHADADADAFKNTTARRRPTRQQSSSEFQEFKTAYPKRAGDQAWRKAERAAHARIREGHAWPEMIAGAKRYAAFVRSNGNENTEYVKQAATFLGPDKSFLELWEISPPKPNGTNGRSDPAAEAAWQAVLHGEPRDTRIQAAVDAVGGWPRIRDRSEFDAVKIKREFCVAFTGAVA